MTVRPRHLPLRTCVGCRSTAPREDLLRVVAVQDQGVLRLDPDPSRVLPGRGASLHHNLSCLELAERRRAFVRALRLPSSPDPTVLREHLTSHTVQPSTNPAREQVDTAMRNSTR